MIIRIGPYSYPLKSIWAFRMVKGSTAPLKIRITRTRFYKRAQQAIIMFEDLDPMERDVIAVASNVTKQAQSLPAHVPVCVFADRTDVSGGLEGVEPHGGHGVGIADFENADREHVYITNCGNGITPNLLGLNRGEFRFDVLPDGGGAGMTFEEDDWSHGFVFADFDADGQYELFVSAGRGHIFTIKDPVVLRRRVTPGLLNILPNLSCTILVDYIMIWEWIWGLI